MGVYIREKGTKLYLEIRNGTSHTWERLGLTLTGRRDEDDAAREIAEKARALREHQIASGSFGMLDPVLSRLSVEEFAEIVAKSKAKKSHVPKAVKYIKAYSKGMKLAGADERFVEGFKKFLQAQDALGDTTRSHYFGALRAVFAEAHHRDAILRNPAQYIHGLPVPEPEKIWLTQEELTALLATVPRAGALGAEMRRAFQFSAYTGLRISDIRALTWGNILRGKTPQLLKRQRKTRNVVGVPLHHEAWEAIRDDAIHGKDEPVFPLLAQTKTESASYFRAWEKTAKLDRRIGWHTARHTFAVRLLESGVDLYTVSKLMGHRSVHTTEVYAKATTPMKQKAIDALPNIGG